MEGPPWGHVFLCHDRAHPGATGEAGPTVHAMNILRLRIRPDAPINLHAPLIRQAPSVVTVSLRAQGSTNRAQAQEAPEPAQTTPSVTAHGGPDALSAAA